MAQALLEKETLDISEINILLGRTVAAEEVAAEDDGVDITPEADVADSADAALESVSEAVVEDVKEDADGK